MQLLLDLREQMMSSWPFLSCFECTKISFHWRQRVCVCVCFLWVYFLYLCVPSGSVQGFAWNFITPSSHTNTQPLSYALTPVLSQSAARFQGYRFANRRSNVSMGVCRLWWGRLNHLLLSRQKAAVAASEALLTTERGPQQTSAVGRVRTGWITGWCQGNIDSWALARATGCVFWSRMNESLIKMWNLIDRGRKTEVELSDRFLFSCSDSPGFASTLCIQDNINLQKREKYDQLQ